MQRFRIERKARIMAIALLSVLAASFAAYALVKYNSTVTNTATIKGYELTLWRTDGTPQAVTAIPWGDVEKGVNKTTEEVFSFTQKLTIKNTGDYFLYPAWNLSPATPLPNNVTVTAEYYATSWSNWPRDDFSALSFIPEGGVCMPIRFTLTVPSDAPRGPIGFTINLRAAMSSSG